MRSFELAKVKDFKRPASTLFKTNLTLVRSVKRFFVVGEIYKLVNFSVSGF